MSSFTPVYIFTWTNILSTFFTVRMFRSVKSYAGVCCFFISIVSGLSLISQIDTLSTFITVRIFRGSKLMFYVNIYACLLYLRTSILSTFFHSVSFCNNIRRYMYLMFLQVYFYHVYLLISRIGALCTFLAVRIIRPLTNLCLYVYFYACTLFTCLAVRILRSGTANTCI